MGSTLSKRHFVVEIFFTRVCCSYVPCSFWLSGNVWLDNCFHHPTDKLTTYFCCSFVHYAVQHSSSTIYISRQAVAFVPEKYVYFAWNHLNIFFWQFQRMGEKFEKCHSLCLQLKMLIDIEYKDLSGNINGHTLLAFTFCLMQFPLFLFCCPRSVATTMLT